MKWIRNNTIALLFLVYLGLMANVGWTVMDWITRNDDPEPLTKGWLVNTTVEQESNTVRWKTKRLRHQSDMIAISVKALPSYRKKVLANTPDYLVDIERKRLIRLENSIRLALKEQTDALNEVDRFLFSHSNPSRRKLRQLRKKTVAIGNSLELIEEKTNGHLNSMKRFLYSPPAFRVR